MASQEVIPLLGTIPTEYRAAVRRRFFDFLNYIEQRLPPNYMSTAADAAWLGICFFHFRGPKVDATSITCAVNRAIEQYGDTFAKDPYELLLDAGICDEHGYPCPEADKL